MIVVLRGKRITAVLEVHYFIFIFIFLYSILFCNFYFPLVLVGQFQQDLDQFNYQEPPWSTEYPWLVNVFNNSPCTPVGNIIQYNLYCNGISTPSFLSFPPFLSSPPSPSLSLSSLSLSSLSLSSLSLSSLSLSSLSLSSLSLSSPFLSSPFLSSPFPSSLLPYCFLLLCFFLIIF
jgi:hypothetical protein